MLQIMQVYTHIICKFHVSNSEYILTLFVLLALLAWDMRIIQIICSLQVLNSIICIYTSFASTQLGITHIDTSLCKYWTHITRIDLHPLS